MHAAAGSRERWSAPNAGAHGGAPAADTPPGRIVAIDVFRGFVLLLLLPDPNGGWSFYAMAQRLPDSALWGALAGAFTHVQWTGASIWDLVMPAFVFIVGAAMPLSVQARRVRGDTNAQIVGHMLLRAAALLMLAFALRIDGTTYVALLWPVLILTVGLPIAAWLGVVFERAPRSLLRRIEVAWSVAVLAASAAWIAAHVYELGHYRFEHILSQLALASLFAFWLIGRPRAVQLGTALAILVGFWLLFAVYPLPDAGFDRAAVGVAPTDEVLGGFFAHWNKNTNPAAAFDVWFLNLLPRAQPFLFDPKGIQTLDFVPTIATMIFGIMTGELMRSRRPKVEIRNVLAAAGLTCFVLGMAASVWLCPSIKCLWTPSYALWTSGLAMLVLALAYELCDIRGWRAWAFPFVVFGSSSILLYVLAVRFRYWLVSIPEKVTGVDWFAGTYGPLLESAAVAAMLFIVALTLHRLRVFVKL
jgi:heparan-alpha-glucosaminide N-acetyltransferase